MDGFSPGHDYVERWVKLENDCRQLENKHKQYVRQIEEMQNTQAGLKKDFIAQREHLEDYMTSLRMFEPVIVAKDDYPIIKDLQEKVALKQSMFDDFEMMLPKKSGTILGIMLGPVDLSLVTHSARFQYKEAYENFKFVMNIISIFLALASLMYHSHILGAVVHFLLVWFYCTLILRENILKLNGSRIKGWWLIHHYISTFLSGILLIWPDGEPYWLFRKQFMSFTLYIAFVQLLQYYYQSGCLYRLRSLGERHSMDVTVDGFYAWMWRGLTFLLPFLFLGHFLQLYNAYTLFQLSFHRDSEWHVPCLSLTFLVLFVGNFSTTVIVVLQKLKSRHGTAKEKKMK